MYPVILLIWVVLVGAYINGPIGDPDLWWHITVGRWIVSNREIPATDLWNAFSDGGVWRAYSWLHEVLYALVEARFGIQGMWVLQLVLAVLMVATFTWLYTRLAKDVFVGALFGAVVTVGCFQNFALRPQTFVWVLFALALALGDSVQRSGLTWRKALGVGIIFCLWANSHITTVIGLGALVLWTLRPDRDGLRTTFYLGLIGFIGTLVTPYFGGEWLTFFSKTDHPLSMTSIVEFKSATIMSYGTGILVLFAGLLVAAFARTPSRIPPARLVLALGLAVAGAAVVKFIPFAVITLGALLAVYWREDRESSAAQSAQHGLYEGIERLRRALAWLPTTGTACLLLAMAVVVIKRSSMQPINTALVPVAALDFIKDNNLATPLLNDFGRGGYVMYRMSDANGALAPEHKVPIDGRTNVNSAQIWAAYRLAVEGRDGWQQLIDLVAPNTILWRRESPLVELLKAKGGWLEVFTSGTAAQGYVVLSREAGTAT